MSKNSKLFIVLFLGMNLVYALFLVGMNAKDRHVNNAPVITFDSDVLNIDVCDDESVLLKGVHASDQEDGDMSDRVFVYNMSSFDDQQQRTVTYAVFDSNDSMSTASRKVTYTNYTAPQFYSDEPLFNLSIKGSSDSSYRKAMSCVDGDISNKVSVSKVEEDNKVIYKYSVTDSTGTSTFLQVSDEISLKSLYTNIDIELSDYIVYVEKGTYLNFRSYIDSVQTSLGKQNELIPYIDIESNFNRSVEGQYEVKYTLNRSNGDYGVSKMIVIVE